MTYKDILNYLKNHRDKKHQTFSRKIGISSVVIGVKASIILQLSKKLKITFDKNTKNIAHQLWQSEIEECRRLAILLTNSKSVEFNTIMDWINTCNSWSQVDCLCGVLLHKLNYYEEIINNCILKDKEFVIRTLIVLCLYMYKKHKIIKPEWINLVNSYKNSKYHLVKKAITWFNKETSNCHQII